MPPSLEQRWQVIRGKLESASKLLGRQGTITSKLASGRRIWSVRFYEPDPSGRRRQKSIYIGGDQELRRRAGELLAEYRERRAICLEAQAMAKLARALVRAAARGIRVAGGTVELERSPPPE